MVVGWFEFALMLLMIIVAISLWYGTALLTVSEEVRSRCSLKHRKSLLISDTCPWTQYPMDTYCSHIADPSCR